MIVFDIEGTVIILRSDMIKKGIDRAPHRSLLRAAGVKEEDMNKPFIAVCNSYIDIVPGHVHLREFSEYVKERQEECRLNLTQLELMMELLWDISVCVIRFQVVN